MILVLKKDTTPRQEAQLLAYLEQLGLAVTREACEGSAVWLLSGGTERVDSGLLSSLPMGYLIQISAHSRVRVSNFSIPPVQRC